MARAPKIKVASPAIGSGAERPGICGVCWRTGARPYPVVLPISGRLERFRCDEHVPEDVREGRTG